MFGLETTTASPDPVGYGMLAAQQRQSLQRKQDVLTAIPLQHYSGAMTSEFDQLSDKIGQLASLTQSLRQENAELRRTIAVLSAENVDLAGRMQQAHQRVAALLAKLPTAESDQEAA